MEIRAFFHVREIGSSSSFDLLLISLKVRGFMAWIVVNRGLCWMIVCTEEHREAIRGVSSLEGTFYYCCYCH